MPKRIRFDEQSVVFDDFYKGSVTRNKTKVHDGPEIEKAKAVVEIPSVEDVRNQKDANIILDDVRKRLDFDKMFELLNDIKFCNRYIDPIHVEVIIGKALVSGELNKAKELLDAARSTGKLGEVYVSNAYFNDFAMRGKRNFTPAEDYQHLLFMTLIRQGDYDTIKFALENAPPNYSLVDAKIRDGDMVFSNWQQNKDVEEMTPEERLIECLPKTKVFETFYELETPLTAFLKNRYTTIVTDSNRHLHYQDFNDEEEEEENVGRSSLKPVNMHFDEYEEDDKLQSKRLTYQEKHLFNLLLDAGADIYGQHYQTFKVAARYGLLSELKMLLQVVYKLKQNKKNRTFQTRIHQIFVSTVAHAAVENRKEIIEYVRSRVDFQQSLTKTGKRLGKKTTLPKNNPLVMQVNQQVAAATTGTRPKARFPKVVQEALKSLVEDGREITCTYRYRLINGIYNLLVLQQEVSQKDPFQSSLSITPAGTPSLLGRSKTLAKREEIEVEPMLKAYGSNDSVQKNDGQLEKRQTKVKSNEKSLLRSPEMVDYSSATKALLDPVTGVMLTTFTNLTGNGTNFSSNESDAGSVKSGASLRKYSSASSITGGSSRKPLVKIQYLHEWFLNIMYQNDYNGENVVLVLFALGLRLFFRPHVKRKPNTDGNSSDASSEWGGESVNSNFSEQDDDENNDPRESDAGSVKSEESDKTSNASSFGGKSAKTYNLFGKKDDDNNSDAGRKPKRRRRSTLNDVMEFFGNAVNKIGEEVSKKTGKTANTKQKVEALELVSQFGSEKVLNAMVDLVASQLSKNVFKCVYFAARDNKFDTTKVFLDKITEEFDDMIKGLKNSDSSENSARQNLQNNSIKRLNSLAGVKTSFPNRAQKNERDRRVNFVQAVNDFLGIMEDLEAQVRAKKNEQIVKQKRLKSRVGPGGRRQSRASSIISQGFQETTQTVRKLSIAITDAISKIPSSMNTLKEAIKSKRGKTKLRRSRKSSAAGESNYNSTSDDDGSHSHRSIKSRLNLNAVGSVTNKLKALRGNLRKSITGAGMIPFGKSAKNSKANGDSKNDSTAEIFKAKLRMRTNTLNNSKLSKDFDSKNPSDKKANGEENPSLSFEDFDKVSLDGLNKSVKRSSKNPDATAARDLMKNRNKTMQRRKFESGIQVEAQESELNDLFAQFLEAIFRVTLKFGAFDVSSLLLENKHINIESSEKMIITFLNKAVSKNRVKKTPRRALRTLVRFLCVHILQDDRKTTRLAEIGRDLLDTGVNIENEKEAIADLRYLIEEIAKVTGPFVEVDDLYKMVLKAVKDHAHPNHGFEWHHFPECMLLAHANMTDDAKKNLNSDMKSKMKKDKVSTKVLNPNVVQTLDEIFATKDANGTDNGVKKLTKKPSKRRRSSLGKMLGMGMRSNSNSSISTGRRTSGVKFRLGSITNKHKMKQFNV